MDNRKRTKQVKELINSVNNYLKTLKIKDETDNLFLFMLNYLIEKRMYEGYNYFNSRMDEDGKCEVISLSGSYTNYDFLQIL